MLLYVQTAVPLRHIPSELIQRKMRVLEQVGGCLHLSSSIKTAFNRFSTGVRSGVPTVVMVIVAGDSVDNYTNTTTSIQSENGDT